MSGRVRTLLDRVLSAGPNGWGYDGLLLAGPVILIVIAILGRTLYTEALATAYVGLFLVAFVYNGLR